MVVPSLQQQVCIYTSVDREHEARQMTSGNVCIRAGETAQWVRAMAALAEDLGLVSSTLMVAHTSSQLQVQGVGRPL